MSVLAEIGWLRIDLEKKECICSDYILKVFDWERERITLSDFQHKVVSEEFGESILKELNLLSVGEVYNRTFVMLSDGKPILMEARFIREECRNGEQNVFFCTLQKVSNLRNTSQNLVQDINDFLTQQDLISHSLLEFLQSEDPRTVVDTILGDLLFHFQGGRAYIFEYDKEKVTQSNTFEVVAEGVQPEIDNLQQIPWEFNPWWTQQIMSQKSIILNRLDEFPPDASHKEKEILELQGIKSIMVAPLISADSAWGYIGIDVVDGYRRWRNEDVQWFSFMANIISICMGLRRSKDKVEQERLSLQNLYRYMPLGYIRLSKPMSTCPVSAYVIVDANTMSSQLVGCLLEKSIGKTLESLEEDVSSEFYSCIELSMREMPVSENLFFNRTGKYCHAIVYYPEPDAVVLLLMDVTENVRIHEELDHSEKLFKNVFANMPVGIEIYDKDGYLMDINHKDLEIFGVNREDALGVNFFLNPNVPDEIKEKVYRNESFDFNFEYSFEDLGNYYQTQRKDSIDLYSRASPLYNNKGQILSYIIINIDMTAQKDAIRKIQDFENLFLMISDYAKIGYVKANLWNKKGYAIKQWFKNNGESEDTPLDKILGVYSKVHPEDREKLLAFYKDAMEGRKTNFRSDIRIHKEDDRQGWKWIRTDAVVTQYCPEQHILEVIGVNNDITEQKEIEAELIKAKNKAEAMDRLKSAFLANMSHEIRTPLNAIVGFSELLTEMDNLKEQKQYIDIIRSNSDLLLQLISDILDLSKIESGTFEFTESEVDVNALCEGVVCATQIKAPEGVEVVFAEHLPECSVRSDRNRLCQVLGNFANNAVKFTSSGSIRIGYVERGDELEFYVEDTGVGIPKEKIASVFERFVKLNDFAPGTGLGLAICQSLVAQIGGKIGVTSEEGEGARFWFTLPRTNAPCSACEVGDPVLGSMSQVTEKALPSILVVEDTESNYLLVLAMLKKEYVLYHAWNGMEAVVKTKELRPDVVLMDIHMPEMDGYEATRRIRAFDDRVPIFAVTAYAFEENKEEALKAGCTGFITKPISGAALKSKIEEVLCV